MESVAISTEVLNDVWGALKDMIDDSWDYYNDKESFFSRTASGRKKLKAWENRLDEAERQLKILSKILNK